MILLIFVWGTLWLIWSTVTFFKYRPRSLCGATVVVTGACSAFGQRLCLQLYARGARVIAWDYSKIRLQELQADASRLLTYNNGGDAPGGGDAAQHSGPNNAENFVVMAVDVSSRLQVQRAVRELTAPVDIVVNAAHLYPSMTRATERGDESLERVIQANVLAPLLVVRQLLPLLFSTPGGASSGGAGTHAPRPREDFAQVVNVVSATANYTLTPDAPEYAASQWGMVGMHYSMREWIAKQRAEYIAGAGCEDSSESSSLLPNVAKQEEAVTGTIRLGNRTPRAARKVRTTLLCLSEVQRGVQPVLNTRLPPVSGIGSFARATSPPAVSPFPSTPDRDGGGGHGGIRARSVPLYRDTYTELLERRNAELADAVEGCIDAISRGQERYVHAVSLTTRVLYPFLILSPIPCAVRLMEWLQGSSVSGSVGGI